MSTFLRRGIIQSVGGGAGEDMNIVETRTETFSASLVKNVALTVPVDLTKAAVLIHSAKLDRTDTDTGTQIVAEFLDASTLELSRQGRTDYNVLVNFSTVEFPSAISVNFYNVDLATSASEDVSITPVDSTNNRIIIFSTQGAISPNSWSDSQSKLFEVLNDSTVRVSSGGASGQTVKFWVVELPA